MSLIKGLSLRIRFQLDTEGPKLMVMACSSLLNNTSKLWISSKCPGSKISTWALARKIQIRVQNQHKYKWKVQLELVSNRQHAILEWLTISQGRNRMLLQETQTCNASLKMISLIEQCRIRKDIAIVTATKVRSQHKNHWKKKKLLEKTTTYLLIN